ADTAEQVVDTLAGLCPSRQPGFTALAGELIGSRGLVIALLGRCSVQDLEEHNRKISPRARRLAICTSDTTNQGRDGEDALQWLSRICWRAAIGGPGVTIAHAWSRLGTNAATRSDPAGAVLR